jgi:Domain of unknown function (DUF6457)
MGPWLRCAADTLALATGEEMTLTGEEIVRLLDVARAAAHESGAKLNAPLACFLLGRATAVSDVPLAQLVERLGLDGGLGHS